MSTWLRTAAAVIGTTLAATAVTALPADAAESQGRATASGGLTVRALPTSASAAKGTIAKGEVFPIVCKVRGSSVGGNNLWYALPPTLGEWVSAGYVANVGPAPRWCGGQQRFDGRTTAALTKRVAPTTAAASAGSLAKGTTVRIVCKLDGQSVGGNKRWYSLTDGRWVTARYVANVSRTPVWCN